MTVRALLFATLAITLSACGDKDDDSGAADSGVEDSESDGPGGTEVAYECTTMCQAEGFTDGTAVEYDHEVNCTCDGASTVSDAACADMCTDIGWSASETYSSTGGDIDSCQCS
jgi:hypothetical protein